MGTSAACPTDLPAGVTAAPQCAIKSSTGDKMCALICSATTDYFSLRAGDAMCGKATCQPIQGTGICTYGAGPSLTPDPNPNPEPIPPAPHQARGYSDGVRQLLRAGAKPELSD